MKYLNLVAILLIFTNCTSQTNLLLNKELITDWSTYPVYPKMVEEKAGVSTWKKEYNYLDSINVYKVTYLSDGLKIRGYVVEPKEDGNYPCIIFNRGGNRGFGALKSAFAAIVLGKIAKEGFVVIASQYRGNGGSEGQEEFGGSDVNDVVILKEVLKEVKTADATNIGMYGWSRGGMMTYIALTKMDGLKAVVTGGANSDLTLIARPIMEQKVYSELIPQYSKNKDEELKKRSAIFWVDKFPKNVPILLLHGNADRRVNSTNALNLALEFEKHRIPYRLKIFEGADHSISEFKEEVDRDAINWFKRFLTNGEAVPTMEYHGL